MGRKIFPGLPSYSLGNFVATWALSCKTATVPMQMQGQLLNFLYNAFTGWRKGNHQ